MNKIDLNHLGEKWLERKKQRMKNLLKITNPDEALYREIMVSLGYPINKVNFLELALILQYSEIKRLKDKQIIEKAFLYRAGFSDDRKMLPEFFDLSLRLDKSVWKYRGIRPANFPEKRLKGIINLLVDSLDNGIVNYFIQNIQKVIQQVDFTKVVTRIMNFDGIGEQRKKEMFFNIILPFVMVYSENKTILNFLQKLFENYPPLGKNKFIKNFEVKFPEIEIRNVKEYMGAIYFINNEKEEDLNSD